MKNYILIIIAIVTVSVASAQTLTANAPSHVAVGEQFRLSYTLDTQNVTDFCIGDVPDAFEVIIGPNRSSQSSFQIINRHPVHVSSITFTYIVVAVKNGNFTIPAAHAKALGKNISSNSVKINVSGQAQSGQSRDSLRQQQMQSRAAGTSISDSDLFIKVSANKKRVYEQEPVLLTYKVYTLVDLTQLGGKMPNLKNFYIHEIPLPQQKKFMTETFNGRQYRTVTWEQYVMFPQKTGKLEIPDFTYEGIVIQKNRSVDPFEAFFNGGPDYVEVKKKIQAPGIIIDVVPLPSRTANLSSNTTPLSSRLAIFSGGVGSFNISVSLDKTEVKVNNPIKLLVEINGVGNMNLLKQPEVRFPKSFDVYGAKVTDKTVLTTNGLEGSIFYDFLAVPCRSGSFIIPAIEYVYFDTRQCQYRTIKSEQKTIRVTDEL